MNSKQTQKTKSRSFDTLLNIVRGVYREVFNSWNSTESKFFVNMGPRLNAFKSIFKNKAIKPQRLELIPIDPNQEPEFIDVKELE